MFVAGKGRNIHIHVIAALRNLDPTLGDSLNTLRRRRNSCGYGLQVTVTQQDARDAVSLARLMEAGLRERNYA